MSRDIDKLLFVRGERIYSRMPDGEGKIRSRATPYKVGEEQAARRYARHLRDGFAKRFRKRAEPQTLEDQIAAMNKVREMDLAMIAEGIEVDGYIYVIMTYPELTPNRVKIGFSDKPVIARLRHIRTSCPEAELVGCWRGSLGIEKHLLRTTGGRVGKYEVFDDQDVEKLVRRFNMLLGQQYDVTGIPFE